MGEAVVARREVPRIEVRDLTVRRGPLEVIAGLSLQIEPGTTAGMVGPNGSGKTTLVEALAGLLPFEGEVFIDGAPASLRDPREALRAGISLCPSNRGLFHRLTVRENLVAGGHLLGRAALRERLEEQLDRLPALGRRLETVAGQLSGGERQLLAIARSLMTRPRFLMLDEPSRGLAPKAVDDMFSITLELTREGVSVLIVDQALDWLYGRVDRLFVFANGRVALEASGSERTLEDVADRYFDLD